MIDGISVHLWQYTLLPNSIMEMHYRVSIMLSPIHHRRHKAQSTKTKSVLKQKATFTDKIHNLWPPCYDHLCHWNTPTNNPLLCWKQNTSPSLLFSPGEDDVQLPKNRKEMSKCGEGISDFFRFFRYPKCTLIFIFLSREISFPNFPVTEMMYTP